MVYRFFLAFAVLGLVVIRSVYQRGYRREDVTKAVRVVENRVSAAVSALLLFPLLLYIFTDRFNPMGFHLPTWLRWFGFCLSGVSHRLLWWSHQALGANWQPDLAIRKNHQLVTTGPYRKIRHPMYLSFILLGIGMTLITANWVIAFFTLLPPSIAYLRRSKREEEMMEKAFGETYREYKGKTGSLLPKM